jgi:hypothetical protein
MMIINIKKTLYQKYKLLPIAIIFILALSVVISYSFYIGYQMTAKYAPLTDAAMEIKLETAMAHLWFEEILSGDTDEDIEQVKQHIANSKWYAKAMIHGGTNSEGNFIPLNDADLEKQILQVLSYIDEFESIVNNRYKHENAGIGSEFDKANDKIFRTLIAEADRVKTELQKIIADELITYKITYVFILIISVFTQ